MSGPGFIGMNTGEVRSLAGQLKNQAQELTNVVSQVDRLLDSLMQNWHGNDATQFHGWWTGQHRPHLLQVAHDIDGLGQSAINNAHDQDQVSSH